MIIEGIVTAVVTVLRWVVGLVPTVSVSIPSIAAASSYWGMFSGVAPLGAFAFWLGVGSALIVVRLALISWRWVRTGGAP